MLVSLKLGWGKLVVLLLISVAVLQVIHMLLLGRLEGRNSNLRRSALLQQQQERTGGAYERIEEARDRDMAAMFDAIMASSVLDASGEFRIVNFLVKPDVATSPGFHKNQQHRNFLSSNQPNPEMEGPGMPGFVSRDSVENVFHSTDDGYYSSKTRQEDVTLVTQCSPIHLHHLVELSERWDGPVSVSVFATDDISTTLQTISELRQCFKAIRQNTSFHLVYPLHHLVQNALLEQPRSAYNQGLDCQTLLQLVRKQQRRPNYNDQKFLYPNNLLRNVARRNAMTEFVFVVDVDMVPNARLHQDFVKFARNSRLFLDNKRDDKTVYVVPAFEAKAGTHIPKDKAGLLPLIEQMQVRPFYVDLCWKCQKHTDYDAWQRESPNKELAVLFEVLWKDPWEPFYIGRNSVPFYDERFKQYGFNRISQVCELHIAGYKFSVLNNAFLVHQGLKTASSFHQRKDADQEHNRLLFRQFKAELKDRYPDSSRRCY